MRLLQVDIDGTRIELHPYVSVVRGLEPRLRARLLSVIEGLATGATTESGLVEAHGVLLDLTPETLALLDLGAEAGATIQPVVRADELPGTAAGPEALARAELHLRRSTIIEALAPAEAAASRADRLRAASEEFLAELDGDAEEGAAGAKAIADLQAIVAERSATRAEAEREALDATADDERAAEAHSAAVAALATARNQRSEAVRECTVAAGALEAARSGRDPFAPAALETAQQHLADLERERDEGEAAPTNAAADGDELDARIVGLEARRDELQVSLLATDAVDPFAVQSALDQVLESDDAGELLPDPAAIALADELAALDERTGAGVASDVEPESLVMARRRLDDARAALAESERRVRVPELDRDEVNKLEDAHETVLTAQDKSEGRFGGARARQRLDEARKAEQVILDELGFLTYADFVMGTSMLNIDPEHEAQLDAARAELADAEDALAVLTAGVDAELEQVEQKAQRRALLDRAADILGVRPGDDPQWQLRNHRVLVQDEGQRYERLRSALAAAGVHSGEGDEHEPIPGPVAIELAKVWLEEQRVAGAARAELEAELAELDSELAKRRRDREDAERVGSSEQSRSHDRIEAARAALVAAEARVSHNDEAEEAIERCRLELERLTEEELAAAAATTVAEAAEAEAATRAHEASVATTARQRELAGALDGELAAVDELRELEQRLDGSSREEDRVAREEAAGSAGEAALLAAVALEALQLDLEGVERRIAELPEPDGSEPEEGIDPEEIEWFLLSRLAAQRAVSYAGSVPLVLDDALSGLPEGAAVRLVERLERMTNAVQVVIVTDDDELASWADEVGVDRAATLLPSAV